MSDDLIPSFSSDMLPYAASAAPNPVKVALTFQELAVVDRQVVAFGSRSSWVCAVRVESCLQRTDEGLLHARQIYARCRSLSAIPSQVSFSEL